MSLVSVVVVVYNSSRTIIDTLNSIAGQSYSDIELIITDDYSKDDTLFVVEKWISQHKGSFRRVELIKADKNSGVTANASRGVECSCGEWIKIIAGDDILKPNAIERFVNEASSVDGEVFFSRMELFSDDSSKSVPASILSYYDRAYKILRQNLSAKEQCDIIRYSNNFCPAPASFFSRKAFDSVGGFDLSIAMAEDMPLWIMITERGYRLNFIDEPLVEYRIGEGSVQRSSSFLVTRQIIKYKYLLKTRDFGVYKHIKQLNGCYSGYNRVLFLLLKMLSLYDIYMFRKKAEAISQKYAVEKRKITIFRTNI